MNSERKIILVSGNPDKAMVAGADIIDVSIGVAPPVFYEEGIKAELENDPGPDRALLYVLEISRRKVREQAESFRQERQGEDSGTLIASDSIAVIPLKSGGYRAINRDELITSRNIRDMALDTVRETRQMMFVGCVSGCLFPDGRTASVVTYYRATIHGGIRLVDCAPHENEVEFPIPIDRLRWWPWEVGFVDPSKIGTALDPFVPLYTQPQTFDTNPGDMARPYISGLVGAAITAVDLSVRGEPIPENLMHVPVLIQ